MKIAYFNLSSGASGDMVVSSFLSAGLSAAWLKNIIRKLKLRGVKALVRRVHRNLLPALSVSFSGGGRLSPEAMKRRIHDAGFSEKVTKRALNILNILIEAESHVHNSIHKNVHFHQLGEADTLVDIAAAAAGIEYFNVDAIAASPINAGSPAPAAACILKKYKAKIYNDDVSFEYERITPTGAAILAGYAVTYGSMPVMKVLATGYGAGEKNIPGQNNLLNVLIGEASERYGAEEERVILIETNIDDMDPRVYPCVMDLLFSKGALDVWLKPIQMKKGRPGITLSVLCAEQSFEQMKTILLRETTTLGIRLTEFKRFCLPRWKKGISKYGVFNKHIKKNIELNDSLRVARQKGLPLYDVLKG